MNHPEHLLSSTSDNFKEKNNYSNHRIHNRHDLGKFWIDKLQ